MNGNKPITTVVAGNADNARAHPCFKKYSNVIWNSKFSYFDPNNIVHNTNLCCSKYHILSLRLTVVCNNSKALKRRAIQYCL